MIFEDRLLVIDMNTLAHKAFYVHKHDDAEVLIKLALNSAINIMNKYFKLYSPCKLICVFDRRNWRKTYTIDNNCIKIYKGHRRKSMPPEQVRMYEAYKQFISQLEAMIIDYTGITVIAEDHLEADDIIAGICHIYGGADSAKNNKSTYTGDYYNNPVTILTVDRDMIQLLRYSNVEVIDLKDGKNITVDDYDTVDYYLYQKYFTGDAGDNVHSALPRLRKTKIKEAYSNPLLHTNYMKTVWKDKDLNEHLVEDIWKENRLLVDLTHQPDWVQELMWSTINRNMQHNRTYNHFSFLQFVGKNTLVNVGKYLDSYVPMLRG
jgi:hypothetical protein